MCVIIRYTEFIPRYITDGRQFDSGPSVCVFALYIYMYIYVYKCVRIDKPLCPSTRATSYTLPRNSPYPPYPPTGSSYTCGAVVYILPSYENSFHNIVLGSRKWAFKSFKLQSAALSKCACIILKALREHPVHTCVSMFVCVCVYEGKVSCVYTFARQNHTNVINSFSTSDVRVNRTGFLNAVVNRGRRCI